MNCNAPHPSIEGVVCTQREGAQPHPFHLDRKSGIDWPNEAFEPPRSVVHSRGKGKKKAEEIAKGNPEPPRVGAPPSPEEHLDRQRPQTDVPADAVAEWSKDAWVDRTYATLVAWVRQNGASVFTTPEDIWPLIDAPREMRAMVLPVRRAIKNGIIIEVGAKRLRDTYRTRDGVEFAMNKLVPIYQGVTS